MDFAEAYGDLHITAVATTTPTVQAAHEPPKSGNRASLSQLLKKMSTGLKLNKTHQPVSDNRLTAIDGECPSLNSVPSIGLRNERVRDATKRGEQLEQIDSNSAHTESKKFSFRTLIEKFRNTPLFKMLSKVGSKSGDNAPEPLSVPYSVFSGESIEPEEEKAVDETGNEAGHVSAEVEPKIGGSIEHGDENEMNRYGEENSVDEMETATGSNTGITPETDTNSTSGTSSSALALKSAHQSNASAPKAPEETTNITVISKPGADPSAINSAVSDIRAVWEKRCSETDHKIPDIFV